MNYDVLIIGGGAVGASIARNLSKYNIKLGLLEKNVEVCQETTKANSAIVHAGYDCEPGTLKARLNVRGNALYPQLSEELDFEFKKCGSLVLAFNEKEVEILNDLYDRGIKNGVPDMEIIGYERIKEIEDKVSDEVLAALYAKSAGVVDPFNYTYAMIENAIKNGLDLYTETEVVGLKKEGQIIEVLTNKGSFKTRYLINAAGLNADKISNMAGDDDYYIIPTKGVYRLFDKNKDSMISTVLFQTPTELGKGVLVTSTYDGNTMVGPTSEQIGDVEDTRTQAESLKIIDELAVKTMPSLDFRNTIRVFTGVRAKPNTGDFMIYPSKHMEGFINVGGIESPGLASSPAIAEYVEEILLGMGFKSELNPDYDGSRKAIPKISQLSIQEKIKKIEENPAYGKIICRCETVSEGEIIDAIKRPGGAVTIDGVKRRVRAGMGRCQGGFCGPRVLEILARELGIDPVEVRKEISGSQIVDRHLKEKR